MHEYLETLDLRLEDRYRGDCPVCAGKNTFTATRTYNNILYNCYKAGCRIGGTQSTTITVEDMKYKMNKQSNKSTFTLPDYFIPNRTEVQEWANQYGLDANNINLLYDVRENRVVFPVEHNSKYVDATGRSLNIKQKPKWKRYGVSSFAYTCGKGEIAVVVEDCISAAVVSSISSKATGVALMGTSLMSDHVAQLQKYSKVIVSLDPDARNKTLLFAQQLRSTVGTSVVSALNTKDDLKYRKRDDIFNLNLLLSY